MTNRLAIVTTNSPTEFKYMIFLQKYDYRHDNL